MKILTNHNNYIFILSFSISFSSTTLSLSTRTTHAISQWVLIDKGVAWETFSCSLYLHGGQSQGLWDSKHRSLYHCSNVLWMWNSVECNVLAEYVEGMGIYRFFNLKLTLLWKRNIYFLKYFVCPLFEQRLLTYLQFTICGPLSAAVELL